MKGFTQEHNVCLAWKSRPRFRDYECNTLTTEVHAFNIVFKNNVLNSFYALLPICTLGWFLEPYNITVFQREELDSFPFSPSPFLEKAIMWVVFHPTCMREREKERLQYQAGTLLNPEEWKAKLPLNLERFDFSTEN